MGSRNHKHDGRYEYTRVCSDSDDSEYQICSTTIYQPQEPHGRSHPDYITSIPYPSSTPRPHPIDKFTSPIYSLAYSSQVSINFFLVPGSYHALAHVSPNHSSPESLTFALCPASGIQCNVVSGHALCKCHAVIGGQTTSYLPCTIVAGICLILSIFSFLSNCPSSNQALFWK
jgi:hypothetical protein